MASAKKNSARPRDKKASNRTYEEYPNTQLSPSDSKSIHQMNAVSSGTCEKIEFGGITESNEMRMIIIGKTGTGKSATGNTILGGKPVFDSKVCGASVTSKCKLGINTRFERKFIVVDTPGLFDTEMTNDQVTKEIVKCIGMTAPGPHAILLTVNVGRFTKEEHDTVKHFVRHFGDDMYNYLIVVFTRADDLENENVDIKDYVKSCPQSLQEILKICEHRYIPFNNKLSGNQQEDQVKTLISKVDKVVLNNGGNCYTNEMYIVAEKTLQRHEQMLKKKLQDEEQARIIELKNDLKVEFDGRLKSAAINISDLTSKITSLQTEKIAADEIIKSTKTDIANLKQKLKEGKKKENSIEVNGKDSEQSNNKDEVFGQTQYEETEDFKKKFEERKRKIHEEYVSKQSSPALRDTSRRACEKEEGLLSKIWNGLKQFAKGVCSLLFRWL